MAGNLADRDDDGREQRGYLAKVTTVLPKPKYCYNNSRGMPGHR